ncbi:MAG TPA: bacillithiol system redox-active protein YtxJ [Cyclobacteriaceae bacterium]|nr:bacillithiol system redox-active protein YtxJ [Cyclobacteriaceae bacterium]
MINWIDLREQAQIENIREESKKQPVLIFKHSTRCSISRTALDRLERNWKPEIKTYYLDLLSYRNISNQIAEYFGVEHESPQVLVVKDGKPVYVRSHLSIDVDEITKAISTN